jgi:hypothetical protein
MPELPYCRPSESLPHSITAISLHLRQAHFGRPNMSALAIFKRDGYILVPIEARRFPEAPVSDEKSASGWVVACVLSVLSEGRLSIKDRDLLRAILSNGTVAIVIDGLNEVAWSQSVMALQQNFHQHRCW